MIIIIMIKVFLKELKYQTIYSIMIIVIITTI